MRVTYTRRTLLNAALAGASGLGALASLRVGAALFGEARAGTAAASRRFVFVINQGGWDPLMVFAPQFGAPHVEMQEGSTQAEVGGIAFVDHAERPSVRAFFEHSHRDTLVWNGLLVPSVAHPPSLRALLTGTSDVGGDADWAARIADAAAAEFPLPGIVLSGPSFGGALVGSVGRAGENGQLNQLLSGSLSEGLDVPVVAPPAAVASAVDACLHGRAERARSGQEADDRWLHAWSEAADRAALLKARQSDVVWSSTSTWDEQLARTTEILAAGLSRTVTLSFALWPWDTHSANDYYQSPNFETLFAGLLSLRQSLATTPGPDGQPLDTNTVVVLLSEMGRTPLYNGGGGRDHWPYTSLMLVGPGITGDRVVGRLDDNYYGLPLDPATAEPDEAGITVEPTHIGATLLTLAGLDADAELPGVRVIDGILA